MTLPIRPERTISTSRAWSRENRSTWPGKTKLLELRAAASSGAAKLADGATGFSSNTARFRLSARKQIATCEAAGVATMMASASASSINCKGLFRHCTPSPERTGSRACGFVSATPTTFASERLARRARCSLPKAPPPATRTRTGSDNVVMNRLATTPCEALILASLRPDFATTNRSTREPL